MQTEVKQLLIAADRARLSMDGALYEFFRNRSEQKRNVWAVANREWNAIWAEIKARVPNEQERQRILRAWVPEAA